MAYVLTDESNYEDIADAIRARGKTTAKFLPSEMATAINNIPNDVTGVKGDAEETYRTGNINLTPENIGAPSLSDFAECIQYRDGIYASRSPSIASVVQVGTYNIGSSSPSDKPEGVIDGTLLIIRNSLNWNMQILFPYSASSGYSLDAYYRLVNRNDYSILIDWTKVYSGTDLQNSIDSLSVAVNRYFLIDSQFISDKNAALANITEDITSIITANQWNDAPAMTTSSQSGVFINRRYSGNYQIQKYIQFDKGNEWIRVVNRNNGTIWKDWMQVTSLPPVKVLAVGDSICNGIRNNNKGFVGDLGLVYKNDGVSGATISTKQTSYKNIFTQLVDESAFTPDVVIANGGINDYELNAPLGTASSAPVASDTQANALDKSTVLGALEYLFYTMVKKYPKAQRFFVTTHKVKYNGKYAPATPNSEGYTQTDMTDAIIAVCKMYNVNVIDVFHEGIIDTIWSQYISPTPYSQDSTVTDKYYVDNDGIHPLALGYKECYLPLVRNALEKVATVNPVT